LSKEKELFTQTLTKTIHGAYTVDRMTSFSKGEISTCRLFSVDKALIRFCNTYSYSQALLSSLTQNFSSTSPPNKIRKLNFNVSESAIIEDRIIHLETSINKMVERSNVRQAFEKQLQIYIKQLELFHCKYLASFGLYLKVRQKISQRWIKILNASLIITHKFER
jgi:hypothetical protein